MHLLNVHPENKMPERICAFENEGSSKTFTHYDNFHLYQRHVLRGARYQKFKLNMSGRTSGDGYYAHPPLHQAQGIQ